MAASREFKRVVLGLHHSSFDRTTVNLAAEFAKLLRLDMFGLFIEDPSVASAASLPFVREFRTLGREWHPIELKRLARDYELSALSARRLLTKAAATHRVTCSFEVIKSTIGQAIMSISQATDIVIIAEPKSAANRIISQFTGLISAALQSEAAVLLVPRQLVRRRGPVVAIAARPGDPSINAAMAIAAAAGENAIVVAVDGEEDAAFGATEHGGPSGIVVEQISMPREVLASSQMLSAMLGGLRERMVVVARGSLGLENEAVPSSLATIRGVPVLIVEKTR